MADMDARIQSKIEEIMGNEALLAMLDTEAAREMLDWGIQTARTLVRKTMDLDDIAAELAILPRLKALRQSMRSIGNWAAGKYADPESRLQLRSKLLEHFRAIFGEEARLPDPEQLDEVLNQADDTNNTPRQLILKLRRVIEEIR